MYRYRIQENTWEAWIPMSEKRRFHSCLLLDDNIVVGGGAYKKISEIFNVREERWQPGPDLPTPISSAQFVKAPPGFKHVAYLIGGFDYGADSASSAIYGLTKDFSKFVQVGKLQKARWAHVALVLPCRC